MTSQSVRVVVVDDERLARAQLQRMLHEHADVEVVGEADDVPSAVEVIGRTRPDAIFLDIQMPGESGFELLPRLERPVQVVFVTAFDAYAIRAFEVNALDYLLKPVTPARLDGTVQRLRGRTPDQSPAPERLLAYEDRLFIPLGGRPQFIRVADVIAVTADDDYSEIHLRDGSRGLVLTPLATWEARLPKQHFVRVHRSAIVQFGAVTRLDPWSNGGYMIHLAGMAEPVTMSRRYATALRDRLR